MENEQADAGRDGWTRLARPNSQAQTGTGKYCFYLFSWPRAGLATLPGWSILSYMWWPYIHTYWRYHEQAKIQCTAAKNNTIFSPSWHKHFFLKNITYSRWTSSLPSCLWSQRIFPSLPGSRLTIFYRDASSALLQLVNQWLNFTYSRSHAFRYERKNTNHSLVRIELTTSALVGVQVNY